MDAVVSEIKMVATVDTTEQARPRFRRVVVVNSSAISETSHRASRALERHLNLDPRVFFDDAPVAQV